jgi:hypothetical protein
MTDTERRRLAVKIIFKRDNIEIWSARSEFLIFGVTIGGDAEAQQRLVVNIV